jgi:hypothetical protein
MSRDLPASSERRSFLTRLNAGFASLVAVSGVAMAQTKSSSSSRWEPALHEKDAWLERPGLKHRTVFDNTSADGVGACLLFSGNFIRTSKAEYGVENNEMAVAIILRHRATAFGYNDAMWAKYGPQLAQRSKFEDPKTKEAPKVNVYNSREYGELLENRGTTLEALAKMGAMFGICSSSTHGYAGLIAQATGGKADAIFNELAANLVTGARMVPAGIITLNHAQERGYTLTTCI